MAAPGLGDSAWGWGLRVFAGVVLGAGVLAMAPGFLDSTGPVKRLVFAMGAAGLALGAAAGWAATKTPPKKPGLLTAIAGFLVAWLVLAAYVNPYPGRGFAAAADLAVGVVWMALLSQICSRPRHMAPIVTVLCGAMVLASVYGFAQRLGADPFPWAYERNELYELLPAAFGNPNYAAHALSLCIVLALYLALGLGKPMWLLAVPVFLAHLALTHQRGGPAALGAALTIVGLAWFVRKHGARTGWGVLAVFGGMALAAVLAVVLTLSANKALTGQWAPLDGSLLKRYNSYASAADMAVEAPFFGHGPGAYAIANVPYWTSFEQAQFAHAHEMNRHVHFDALEFAAEAGLPAAFAYIALLTMAATLGLGMALGERAPERRRFGLFAAAFAVAFAADGLFGFNLRVPVSMMTGFTVLGVIEGTARRERSGAAGGLPGYAGAAVTVLAALCALGMSVEVFRAERALGQGTQLAQALRTSGALAAFERAAVLAPWDERGPIETAELLADRPLQAAAAYRDALERNPHSFMARLNLARILIEEADKPDLNGSELLEEAQAHIEHALALCPVLPEAHHAAANVTLVKLRRGTRDVDLVSPEKHLLQALRGGYADRGELLQELSYLRMYQGDEAGAMDALEQGLRLDPANARLWASRFGYAIAAPDAPERQDRLHAFDEFLTACWVREFNRQPQPGDTLAVLCIYRAQLALNLHRDRERALELSEWAIDFDPANLNAWMWWTMRAPPADTALPLAKIREKLAAVQGKPNLPFVLQAAHLALSGGTNARYDASVMLREEAAMHGAKDSGALTWAAELAERGITRPQTETETLTNLALVWQLCGGHRAAGLRYARIAKEYAPDVSAWHEADRIERLMQDLPYLKQIDAYRTLLEMLQEEECS